MKKPNKKYIEILWSFTGSKKLFTFHWLLPRNSFFAFINFLHFNFSFLINRELSNFTMAINFTFLFREALHNFFSHSEVIQWRFSLENNFPRSKFQPTQRSSKIVLKKQKSVLLVLHSTRFSACVGRFLLLSYRFYSAHCLTSEGVWSSVSMKADECIYRHNSCVTT